MAQKYKFASDLKQAQMMAEQLEGYVRSKQLYGYAAGLFSNMPSLTIGALLLRLRRLDLLRDHLKDRQLKALDQSIDRYAQVRHEWMYHYSEKAQQEAQSRIDAMKGFFYECRDNIHNCIGIYKPEMMRRTIIQELLYEFDDLNLKPDTDLIDKIRQTDQNLRQITEPSDFQWAHILQAAYDRDSFWWLYASPPDLH